MGRLRASLPPFLIPGSGGFPLVWMWLQECNICICVSEKGRRRVTGRGKRDLSKDGASSSCHPCHLPAPVWADGNRAPLGDGSATHASLPTAFRSLSWTAWCCTAAPPAQAQPPLCDHHTQRSVPWTRKEVVCLLEVGSETLRCSDQILLNSGQCFPPFQYLLCACQEKEDFYRNEQTQQKASYSFS